MKLGGESKSKMLVLGGLVLLGGYLFYTNVLSDSDAPRRQEGAVTTQNKAIGSIISPEAAQTAPRGPVVRASSRAKSTEDFHPSLKRKPEDAIDPGKIDPSIRLDLLAKVQSVEMENAGRNPFQFGQAPPPPPPKDAPKVDPKKLIEAMNRQKAEPPKDPGPPKPPPLNLSWKYYGYASPPGSARKKAFFLDGEDILTATEGEVLKKKFRVVRIGVNSVVVEDTETKSQQQLPLQEEAATG